MGLRLMSDDLDGDALQRGMAAALADETIAALLQSKLDHGEHWTEVAQSAAFHCQHTSLRLRPWELAPMDADESEILFIDGPDHNRLADAQRLLRQMLDAGLSRYEPFPLDALKKKKRKAKK
jgi:hypothetical protein